MVSAQETNTRNNDFSRRSDENRDFGSRDFGSSSSNNRRFDDYRSDRRKNHQDFDRYNQPSSNVYRDNRNQTRSTSNRVYFADQLHSQCRPRLNNRSNIALTNPGVNRTDHEDDFSHIDFGFRESSARCFAILVSQAPVVGEGIRSITTLSSARDSSKGRVPGTLSTPITTGICENYRPTCLAPVTTPQLLPWLQTSLQPPVTTAPVITGVLSVSVTTAYTRYQ